jgi:hypothetical protein
LCLTSCSQDLGEECQVDSDCSGSLVCERAKGSDRGVCQDQHMRTPTTKQDSGAGSDKLPDDDAGASGGDAG